MTEGFSPSIADKELSNLELQFPPVETGVTPLGQRILVQIRVPKRMVGRIIIPDDARDTEQDNTTVGKVLAMGPVAFKKRTDLTEWPEGQWVNVGDFVMVPKYAGLRWRVKSPLSDDNVELVMFEDLNVIAKITGNPLEFRAFL